MAEPASPAEPSVVLAIFLLIVGMLFSAYVLLAQVVAVRTAMPWYLPPAVYALSLVATLVASTRVRRSRRIYLMILAMVDCALAIGFMQMLS